MRVHLLGKGGDLEACSFLEKHQLYPLGFCQHLVFLLLVGLDAAEPVCEDDACLSWGAGLMACGGERAGKGGVGLMRVHV